MFEPASSARQLVCFDSAESRWRGRVPLKYAVLVEE
jgi:hypothetical protein